MKHIHIGIVVFALLFLLTKPVSAMEQITESTATLAAHEVSKDHRVEHLEKFLKSHRSPLANEAEHFVEAADTYNLDWKLVAAISGTESTFGEHIPPGSHNAWGWGIPTGAQSGLSFKDWDSAITAVSKGLRENYFDRGAKTIEQVGRIYAASPVWASHVKFFLNKIETFTPNEPELLDITI